MTTYPATTDVLIIGSGPIGAGIAARLRTELPSTTICMIDAGPPIGSSPGEHLHDLPEPEIRARFTKRASLGPQAVYVGAHYTGVADGDPIDYPPGLFDLQAFREDAGLLPGAAVSWNVGGMGVHWSAACPTPYGDEVPDFLPPDEWAADLETAQGLLRVNPAPYPGSEAGRRSLDALRTVFRGVSDPGREPQHMPMAVNPETAGWLARTGPNRVFPAMSSGQDPAFRLFANTLCLRVLRDGERACGARVRDLRDGSEHEIRAQIVFVCADTLRTPQLLWASGIRPPALGRYLNEHAFLSGRVTVDESRFGITRAMRPRFDPDEPFAGSFWLPHSNERQPFHGHLIEFLNLAAKDSEETVYSISFGVYVPLAVRAENRVEFLDGETDAAGMPRMRIRFSYDAEDLERIEQAREMQRHGTSVLGDFDPAVDSGLLAPGSSLHLTGTTRMGPSDDGTSVCDTDGRVWDVDDLYLGGGGVVPTALACNSTLTSMVFAVRTARAAAKRLAGSA